MPSEPITLHLDGHEVQVTNPDKVFFPVLGLTKHHLVSYYLAVAPAVLRAVADRPLNLKRYPDGVEKPPFFQKRAPSPRPEWIKTTMVTFPGGNVADEVLVTDRASLAWVVNLGCVDLNPWPVRASNVDHPDELRIDLDPTPGATWERICTVAHCVRDVLREHGLEGFAKTSGSRGIHVYARVQPRWEFVAIRRAAVALAREVERRLPGEATASWWKEERPEGSVFLDYNQNARDRSIASAYAVRPSKDARVSCPITWDECGTIDPAAFTVATVPARLETVGDPMAAMDEHAGTLDALLERADRDEAAGLQDLPWPPNFPKMAGEPPRVQPSKRRKN